jgi:hypothetical protein
LRDLKLSDAIPPVGSRALVPVPAADQRFRDIKTVAVVSAISDTLNLEHFGSFGSHTTMQFALPDWHIDEALEAQTRKILAQRFMVKDVAVDRQKLMQARLLDDKHAFHPNLSALEPTDAVDAYVVLLKHPRATGGSPVESAGIGLWNVNALAGERTDLFANYAVAIVRARDVDLIVARMATVSPRYQSRFPFKPVDNSTWPKSPPQLSAEQQEKVRAGLTEILVDSLDETLLQMGLTNMMIADSWSVASPGVQ